MCDKPKLATKSTPSESERSKVILSGYAPVSGALLALVPGPLGVEEWPRPLLHGIGWLLGLPRLPLSAKAHAERAGPTDASSGDGPARPLWAPSADWCYMPSN